MVKKQHSKDRMIITKTEWGSAKSKEPQSPFKRLPFYCCANFMIQGGDPTGTGRGGESIWGNPFKDEVNSKLLHSGRGVVGMENSGPPTNGSLFFILYKSANHLNFKHTAFGRVVGGMMTLKAMEKVPVDDNDIPLILNRSLLCEHKLHVTNYFILICS